MVPEIWYLFYLSVSLLFRVYLGLVYTWGYRFSTIVVWDPNESRGAGSTQPHNIYVPMSADLTTHTKLQIHTCYNKDAQDTMDDIAPSHTYL